MRAYFSRRYRFSASHRLHSDSFTPEQNAETYGKCNNPYGHGHNYILEVTVGGKIHEPTGMVCDLLDLDRCVHEQVIARYDLTNLNLLEDFRDTVPTTENLCIRAWQRIHTAFQGAELVRIRVEETSNNFFEYAGEGNGTGYGTHTGNRPQWHQ